MQVCDIDLDGSAPWELLRKYGGKFGFFEKIKMGGVGSPRIVYKSGFSQIDDFLERVPGSDVPYTNFENLKNGILVRINKTQFYKGILIALDEITYIELSISKKLLTQGNFQEELEKANIESAQLIITSLHEQQLHCEVPLQSYEGLRNFFQKHKILKDKFQSEIID